MAGRAAKARVHPLVRSGQYVIATIDFTGLQDDDHFAWSLVSADFTTDAHMMGVRLVGLVNDEIVFTGVDAAGKNVTSAGVTTRGNQRMQLVYDAPEAETIGLFLPGAPYILDVPIIEGEVPAGTLDGAEGPVDASRVTDAPRFELESFSRELDGAVETLTSTEDVVDTLGSDVLFAVDSDELSADAADAVAQHLIGCEPGTVSVVGHTDDVLGADYNQQLSERRAQAVAAELKKHIDTATYPIETQSKGKSEPLVKNDSDENRVKNWRVSITLVSEITTTTELHRSGELPEMEDGPSGTGAEDIEMGNETTTRHYRYTATAREVDEHVIVDLEIEALDEQVDSAIGIGTLAGQWNYRGDNAAEVGRTTSDIQIMDDATRVFPLDHYYSENSREEEIWLPATVYARCIDWMSARAGLSA